MAGAALAAKQAFDRDIRMAWHMAAFVGAAQAGQLKGLDTYIPKETKSQTNEDMLAVFFEMQEAGAPISIRRVN